MQQVVALPWRNAVEPTVQEKEVLKFLSLQLIRDFWKIIHKLLHKKCNIQVRWRYFHTWRSWGIDGAGNENLPRATTTWNSHKGEKAILQVTDKRQTLFKNSGWAGNSSAFALSSLSLMKIKENLKGSSQIRIKRKKEEKMKLVFLAANILHAILTSSTLFIYKKYTSVIIYKTHNIELLAFFRIDVLIPKT